MSKGGDQVQETSQQRAMAEHAVNLMNDYKARWLPVQQKFAKQVEAMGAPGSAQRREAAGKAATDTQIQFAQAQGALEKGLTAAGAAPGSSRANLAITGVGSDLAKSKGLSTMISDQQIEDAYTQGLGALMNIGQGKAGSVANSMAIQAQQSGYQSAADAAAALAEKQGYAQLAGQVAGYGLQSAMAPNPYGADYTRTGTYRGPTGGGMGTPQAGV